MTVELEGHGIPFDPILPEENPPVDESKPAKKEHSKDDRKKLKEKKTGSNFMLIILVFVAILSLATAGALYIGKESETTKRLEAEENLNQMRIAKQELQQELKDTQNVKRQLEIDIEQRKESYLQLSEQFNKEQAEKENLLLKFNQKVEMLASMKKRLDDEKSQTEILGRKLETVTYENEDIKKQLSQIRTAKEALENRIIQMSRKKKSDGVELETIIVDENSAPVSEEPAFNSGLGTETHFVPLGPTARLEGQVLVVNKEFSFVVINIGEKDGIKSEEVLDVYRGKELLGKVQVERIYDTMSSAVILPSTQVEIKEGDIVKLI
ncbi:MAG: hypothetical protein HY810_02000 [Candidatus Omnitrophica bacterium]|nr:hypothetical protein [Candidatus Omnitrophota bacterium]